MTPQDYIVAAIIGFVVAALFYAFVMCVWGSLWLALAAGPMRFWAWPLWLALFVWLCVTIFLIMVEMAAEGV